MHLFFPFNKLNKRIFNSFSFFFPLKQKQTHFHSLFLSKEIKMCRNSDKKLPLFFLLLSMVFAQLSLLSRGDVGTAAQYSPPYLRKYINFSLSI